MNRKSGKSLSFMICLVMAAIVGGRQYYKFTAKHGFFYSLNPELGGLLIFVSIAIVLAVLGFFIFKENKGVNEDN